MNNEYLERITINNEICNGKPTIRNMRFTVTQLLELLASGMKTDEILEDYDFLEEEDIKAALVYAAKLSNPQSVVPIVAA
ncbi:MAG: DUF433 domain-containing protein [Saprospiraceae bacterium]|jgi:uncharacterized protein (DUF433 family)|nr:DUF433 domain-containing protein [Saprospiraceae bacterium]MBK8670874.1 DUF433 domain-containing protein [Saprospiraceae bacterium]